MTRDELVSLTDRCAIMFCNENEIFDFLLICQNLHIIWNNGHDALHYVHDYKDTLLNGVSQIVRDESKRRFLMIKSFCFLIFDASYTKHINASVIIDKYYDS